MVHNRKGLKKPGNWDGSLHPYQNWMLEGRRRDRAVRFVETVGSYDVESGTPEGERHVHCFAFVRDQLPYKSVNLVYDLVNLTDRQDAMDETLS